MVRVRFGVFFLLLLLFIFLSIQWHHYFCLDSYYSSYDGTDLSFAQPWCLHTAGGGWGKVWVGVMMGREYSRCNHSLRLSLCWSL